MSHCGSGLSRRAAGCGALDPFPREPILLYSYERLLLLSLHYPCQARRCTLAKPGSATWLDGKTWTHTVKHGRCVRAPVSILQNGKE